MLRGLFLSIGFPVLACLVWAAVNAPSLDSISFQSSLRDSIEQMTSLYREYPLVAAGLHIVLLLKGFSILRPRYRSMGPSLLTIALLTGGVWWGATKVGLDPASLLAGGIGEIGSPSHAGQSQDLPSTGNPPQRPVPVVPTLVLPPARPNMLDQHVSRVIEAIDMYPNADGLPAATGYVGVAPAVFILGPKSQISAASANLAKYATQPCEPGESTMSGLAVSGCTAWVEDASIGPVSLPKMFVFFTPSLEKSHVVLGASAIANLKLTKTSSGIVTLRRKN